MSDNSPQAQTLSSEDIEANLANLEAAASEGLVQVSDWRTGRIRLQLSPGRKPSGLKRYKRKRSNSYQTLFDDSEHARLKRFWPEGESCMKFTYRVMMLGLQVLEQAESDSTRSIE